MRIGVVMVAVIMCLFVLMVMRVIMGMMIPVFTRMSIRIANQPARASAKIITQRTILNIAAGS